MSTRVLVVDDTVVFRRVISQALAEIPGVEVVGTASTGKLALSRLAALRPDLVTLDIEMPEMNGIEVLQAMKTAGMASQVIVLSALTVRGGELTMRALDLGALDFITKPDGGSTESNLALLRTRLQPMIRAFEQRRLIRDILQRKPEQPTAAASATTVRTGGAQHQSRTVRRAGPPIVLIGVSTGGPAALATLIPALPPDLAVPIFIVQHMPPLFTQPLALSLANKSSIPVTEAQDNEIASPNHAYIAPGGRQMKIMSDPRGAIVVRITDDPPENNCRPAVDYLFRSAALNFPGRATAVILTGMGRDGTEGLKMLKRTGCSTIAQDESSSVVFGMPKEAILAGVVDTVEPLDMIASAIVRSVRGGNI